MNERDTGSQERESKVKKEESLLFGVDMIKEIDNNFVADDSSNASMPL